MYVGVVHAAGGHMVAAYQPRQAYDMMKTFLHSNEFFTPPDEVKVSVGGVKGGGTEGIDVCLCLCC